MMVADAASNCLVHPLDDRISEDENLRELCRPLAALLGELLRTAEGWSRYDAVDAISPCTVQAFPPNDLILTGLVICMGDRGREWKEPFSASLHVSQGSPPPIRYDLRFGDAARGLGKCPYGTPHDFPYVPVANWIFEFASSASDVTNL
jgi:hypothetical protein